MHGILLLVFPEINSAFHPSTRTPSGVRGVIKPEKRQKKRKKKGKSASLPFSGKGKVRWQFQIKPTTDPITFPFSLLRERKRQFFFFNLYFVVQNKTETENLIQYLVFTILQLFAAIYSLFLPEHPSFPLDVKQ